MKPFVIYTGLRILLFLVALGLIYGAWGLVAGGVSDAGSVICLVLSFLLSGLGSFVLLDKQRTEFAERVEQRAARATRAFEERKAKEDGNEPS